MRDLTSEEQRILAQRQDEFPRLVAEIAPGVIELATYLGHEPPHTALRVPERFLLELERFLRTVELGQMSEGQMIWLNTRLAFFVIELLVHRHGGHPFVQMDPDSDYFLHYVVGNFDDGTPRTTIVEPFDLTYAVLHQPLGRSLVGAITDLQLGSDNRR
jgi:hypothetical protein